MPVEPKLAATVILLRKRIPDLPKDNCEFEVFMAKRHDNNKFLGGHHVFPGGSIDDQDINNKSRERIIGLDKNFVNNLKDINIDPSVFWIIAIRELFEETGILLATNESGDLIAINEENKKKFQRYQEDLQKNRVTMTNILTKENLYYNASKVKYFGRLITPAMSPIRFDTHFFLCKLPYKQNINLFSGELTEGLWGSPKRVLELYKMNQIKIIFPQYSTLRRLRWFKTIQEAFNNSKTEFRNNQFIRLKK
jgi:8-oxo-dGTP pyrophosphatase MutT (NUDIX family)